MPKLLPVVLLTFLLGLMASFVVKTDNNDKLTSAEQETVNLLQSRIHTSYGIEVSDDDTIMKYVRDENTDPPTCFLLVYFGQSVTTTPVPCVTVNKVIDTE